MIFLCRRSVFDPGTGRVIISFFFSAHIYSFVKSLKSAFVPWMDSARLVPSFGVHPSTLIGHIVTVNHVNSASGAQACHGRDTAQSITDLGR